MNALGRWTSLPLSPHWEHQADDQRVPKEAKAATRLTERGSVKAMMLGESAITQAEPVSNREHTRSNSDNPTPSDREGTPTSNSKQVTKVTPTHHTHPGKPTTRGVVRPVVGLFSVLWGEEGCDGGAAG